MVAIDFDSRAALQAVLDSEPDLSACGMRDGHPDFEASRLRFVEWELDGFEAAVRWLSRQERRKTINRAFSSYTLKHAAERMEGIYICNGALIAAAIHLEIPFKRMWPGSPNVYFAIGRKRGWYANYELGWN